MGSAMFKRKRNSRIFFLMAFRVLSDRKTRGKKKWTKPISKKFSLSDRLFIAYQEPNVRNNSPDKTSHHF